MTSIRDLAIATLMASDSESEAEMTSVSCQEVRQKRYTCTVCGKSFSQKRDLERHTRTHTGQKPYICASCGKGFSQKSNLERHSNIHTKAKSTMCHICGFTFALNANLTRHMKTHTGEKPYDCKDCGKLSPSRTHRTLHMLSHTGEKPSLCHLCGKQYALKTSLNRHVTRLHTPDNEAMSQNEWTKTVRFVDSSSCPKCKDDICRCSENMSPEGPPKCSSCNDFVCVCNTRDQNEYQEFRNKGFNKFMKIYEGDKSRQNKDNKDNEDNEDSEDNEGYRDWCNHSKRRWAQNRAGSQIMMKGDCVITHDMEDNKCYKKWLEKLYRKDPRRTKESKKGRSEEMQYQNFKDIKPSGQQTPNAISTI